MVFSDLMINLVIGIIGGVFSSIIVSRVFLLQSVHKEQFLQVKELFEESTNIYYLFMIDLKDLEKGNIVEGTQEAQIILSSLKTDIHTYRIEATKSFFNIDEDIVDDELYKIAFGLYRYGEHMDSQNQLTWMKVLEMRDELEKRRIPFCQYRRNTLKYFNKRLVKDAFLRILAVVFLLMIIVTIVA